MKPGVSTLNPYAASYIPLSKREAADQIEVPGWTTRASQGGNQTFCYGPAENMAQNWQQDKVPSIPQVSVLTSQSAPGFYGSSSQRANEMTEKQMLLDDEAEMDLEYLRMTFPGISYESLTDVYTANKGDLEAAVDMLNQLEVNFITLLW